MLATTDTILGPAPPSSAYLEGYRILRTTLWALWKREPFRTILVTSALPGEGKTTVSLNLATVFALTGKRTVVVDGDADQESLGRILGIKGRPGLTDICAGTAAIDAVLMQTELEALQATSVGTMPHLAAELAARSAMPDAINNIADQAEFMILDAAPVLGFSTALSLAPLFDLVVVVAKARNHAGPVRQAIGSLLDVGAKVAGVVVNDIQPQDSMTAASYYHYYKMEA